MVEVQKFWVKPNAQHSNAKAKSKGRAKMSKERNKKVQQNSQAKQKKEKAQQNSKAKQKHSFVFKQKSGIELHLSYLYGNLSFLDTIFFSI